MTRSNLVVYSRLVIIIIAEYLGYLNYDHLIQDFNPNKSSLNETLETISASDLKKGVTCQYSPAGEVL